MVSVGVKHHDYLLSLSSELRSCVKVEVDVLGVGSNPRFVSPFTSKVTICGHRLVILPLTLNVMLKWLSSLPTLMQNQVPVRGEGVVLGIVLIRR